MRILPILVAVAVLAGCTGPSVEDPDVVRLRVLMADDWADTDEVIDVVRTFERDNPGVVVSVIPRPFSQILDDLASEVAAGRPPDVVHQHVYAAAARGLAEPLDDLWADGTLDRDDYFPGAITDVSWGEGIYGVPLDINAMFMLLDADLVDRLGVPETFPEVRAFAEAAVDEGRRGLTLPASTWVTYGWVRANGGEYVEIADDGTPTFTLDAPEVVEALDFLGDLVADDLAFGPAGRGVGTNAEELFAGGETALLTTGTWAVAGLEAERVRPFVAAPMPRGTTGTTEGTSLGGSSLLVGRGSGNRDLAVDFILALTARDRELPLAADEGRMPARVATYDDPQLQAPALDTLRLQLPSAEPMLMDAFPVPEAALSFAIEQILTGRASAADALAEAQAAAVEGTGRR
jgi:multiple sugar transport system substrate-binding protein